MRLRSRLFHFVLLIPCLMLSGCVALGVLAYKLKPPETIHPKYTNLVNQSVGVMVWADRGIRIDWPTLQLDLANSVDHKLKEQTVDAKGKPKAKTMLGVTYPYPPASIVRYMQDHPDVEALPIVDVAPRLGVTRLIYVELEDFATRSDQAVELFRGRGKVTVRVIEVDPDGHAHVAYTWENVQVSYPPKVPPEGIPGAGDQRIYVGTLDALGTEVAQLFFPYQVEE
jgi:hypothetical protein